MSDYMDKLMAGKSAAELRQMADESNKRSQESFDRCDTDGFLSQWASDLTAGQLRKQADIVEAGGKARFRGLYQGDRRVAARQVELPAFNAPWRTEFKWLLREDEQAKFGKRYLPVERAYGEEKPRSRVQKQLGLSERLELAPAATKIGGNGKGLSGAASAYVDVYRSGDKWGTDAEMVRD